MEGMEETCGRLGVCPRCGRTAELAVCPACDLEMVDCEKERNSALYKDYNIAKKAGDEDSIGFSRWLWQKHIFEHYIYKKGLLEKKYSDKYINQEYKRDEFIGNVCPFCDSFKTRKITFAEKFTDFTSNGFKGKKRKRERHCDDCNHDY